MYIYLVVLPPFTSCDYKTIALCEHILEVAQLLMQIL